MTAIKVLRDTRPFYLAAIELSYQELGYPTKLDPRCNMLEIFPKGYTVPKSNEETIIEKWIN